MRYLVTGGAGFIGSHMAAALREGGHQVRILDNFSTGDRRNLEVPKGSQSKERLELVEGDIRDETTLAKALGGVEVVFHEAAFVSVPGSVADPDRCFDVNCTGTVRLLEAARRAGVRRVVLASSAAVYGDSAALPLGEDQQPQPLSPYAASKLVDETYASLYTRTMSLEVCALRYFNVYGPRQNPDTPYAAAVPIFVRQLLMKEAPTIYGDGGQTRDLIYVRDVVRANLLAAEVPSAAGQVINVCTGRKTRILDLVEALYQLLPGAPAARFAPKRSGDIYESVGSPVKAREVLGFSAQTALLDGLRETVQWMQ